ncbi:MAG: HAD family hydrolase [Oribacterium sp.]|nr:HAD family hydrolase [Oribacterium sp.]
MKKIKMVLFDLDGTLLPMDMEEFTGGYFKLLASKAAPRGYDFQSIVKAIWHGVMAMVKNDGSCKNEDAFWKDFASIFGEDKAVEDRPLFDEFYANEFKDAKIFCGYNREAAETVRWIKNRGFRIALATNPLFPSVATETRIHWAGLEPDEFEFFTTYENSNYCKPNLGYYREVLEKAGLNGEDCLMVGNDVSEDMIAAELGMKVFLLTDCMINKENKDINQYPHGNFEELKKYMEKEIMAE